LGSTQQFTNYAGSNPNDSLFYPFGQPGPQGSGAYFEALWSGFEDGNFWSTTTGEWQTDTRRYTPGAGRWYTPDLIGKAAARLDDPQTWNMYTYVRNNPTTLTDPSGEYQDNITFAMEALTPFVDEWVKAGSYLDKEASTETGVAGPNSPAPPPRADPDGEVGTDPSSNPSPSTTYTPANGMPTALTSSAHGKGEKGRTSKPDKPVKGVQPVRDKNGKIVGWSIPSPDGKRTPKSLEWGRANGLDPNNFKTAANVGTVGLLGAAAAYIISTAPEWGPVVAGAAAF
jgi:RHS repeat-associated protein